MGQFLLLLVVALTVAAVVFGVTVLATGNDPGLAPAEPDGRAVPLPVTRPLVEADVSQVRFDTTVRGYRMAQVDQALRRAAYDIGYKDELIGVLEAEVTALREGRPADADALRRARQAALVPAATAAGPESAGPADPGPESAGPAGADAGSADPGPAGAARDRSGDVAATADPNGAEPADPGTASPAGPVAGGEDAVDPRAAAPGTGGSAAPTASPGADQAGNAVEPSADRQPAAEASQPDQSDQARGPVPSERA
ncbi:DivIVA domain-containing protein [Solwaraspora sp. WMMD1047]|uniref:DivIVA domain-containing protein n=1 Tax=Solwaraspora sp. WMMD1047 TaxID=3016102 RepID=UPI00241732DB|nr:DivIVA domain-containing protein [Solwaraspora sp. WMMD1047]MDG4833547.1 DivIVA domain-containing protein [Solwaraspora sp. WMMD1047]